MTENKRLQPLTIPTKAGPEGSQSPKGALRQPVFLASSGSGGLSLPEPGAGKNEYRALVGMECHLCVDSKL